MAAVVVAVLASLGKVAAERGATFPPNAVFVGKAVAAAPQHLHPALLIPAALMAAVVVGRISAIRIAHRAAAELFALSGPETPAASHQLA
jgi:hypothetical protein